MANMLLLSGALGGLGYLSFQKFKQSEVAMAEGEMNEFEIDFASSLEDGQMKELKVGPKDSDKVLVARY